MPEKTEYAKCACESCGGRIEYPLAMAGSTVDCPHCRFPTPLPGAIAANTPPARGVNPAVWKTVALLVAVAGIAYGAWTVNTQRAVTSLAPAPPTPPTSATRRPANGPGTPAPTPHPAEWHGLQSVGDVALEKAGEGSLVYAVGVLRNTTDKQKFGVKVEVDLFDTHGAKIGSATDYADTIGAGAKWHFHALVVGAGAVKARIKDVTEN